MSFKEAVDILTSSKRPIEVFGEGTEEKIKKRYRSYVKICHPDIVSNECKDLAEKIMKILNNFYKRALDEIKKGIYDVTDEKEVLKASEALFALTIRNKEYTFYKYLYSEDVGDIYEGLCEDERVLIKICSDEDDNDLVKNEYQLLLKLNHASIPKVMTRLRVNDKEAFISSKPEGLGLDEFLRNYGYLSGEHICWVLERLLSCIGYLHSLKIVHGNIKEDNILINPDTHNVILKDYSLCIVDANEKDSSYKIINDSYTPDYVSKDSKVIPNTDIYAVGKIAIKLLGGDIDRVALPVTCDIRVRQFIRKLLDKNSNDAWQLWDELIKIRTEVYGSKRFQTLRKVRRNV